MQIWSMSVPVLPPITSSWYGMPSCFAILVRSARIPAESAGAMPTIGPPPSDAYFALLQAGLDGKAHVHADCLRRIERVGRRSRAGTARLLPRGEQDDHLPGEIFPRRAAAPRGSPPRTRRGRQATGRSRGSPEAAGACRCTRRGPPGETSSFAAPSSCRDRPPFPRAAAACPRRTRPADDAPSAFRAPSTVTGEPGSTRRSIPPQGAIRRTRPRRSPSPSC